MKHTLLKTMLASVLVCGIAVALALASSSSAAPASRTVMPWMCLERCNFTSADIHAHLEQLLRHKEDIDAVAFELFNLGPNKQLITNKLTSVAPQLQVMGFDTYAMISSYPYPPEFLDWMREVFADPYTFIDQALSAAKARGLTGLNVDWEPTATATPQDALNYAAFLTAFADAAHERGLKISVDFATWNSVWDWTALSKSSLDTACLMSTYTGNFTIFQTMLNRAVSTFPIDKLGVGLQNINPDTNKPYSNKDLDERFALIVKSKATQIDIWDMPIPDNWWPYIRSWKHQQ